ncbi:redoxin domain-containing protein [bacterium]|nr:MAG: redoxin domain-containing protein [bacterium]
MSKTRYLAPLAVGALVIAGFSYRQANSRGTPGSLEFVGGPWLNVAGGRPIALASRTDHPTLIAFWTFGCSNCQANLAPYARLYAKYKPLGVELVAIHTPEMSHERRTEAVEEHIERFKIPYPVLVDNDNKNWNRWSVRYWPTLFLLDRKGRVVKKWEGELNYGRAQGEAEVARALDGLLTRR